MTAVYPAPATQTDSDIAALHLISGVVVAYTAVASVQCDHCAEVGALTEARIYGGDHYAETCLHCAPGVADEFTRGTDDDVIVELHTGAA